MLTFLKPVGSEVDRATSSPTSSTPSPTTSPKALGPADGLFFARDFLRFATRGMRVAKVAGREAIRTGKLLGA